MKTIEIQVSKTEKFGTHFKVNGKRIGYIGKDFFRGEGYYNGDLHPHFGINCSGVPYCEAYEFVKSELELICRLFGLDVRFVEIN